MGVIDNTISVGKAMFEALQAENARLREDVAALRVEVKDLKAENAKLADGRKDPRARWGVPEGYAAFSPQPGVTVYRYTASDDNRAAEHFLCPKCLHLWGNKLILQFKDAQASVGKCPQCYSRYRFKPGKRFF